MRSLAVSLLLCAPFCFSQSVSEKMDRGVKDFLSAPAAYSANLSVYVAKDNGDFVYEFQGNKGLSTASTQKIFTAACALETLGRNFTYKTTAAYSGQVAGGTLNGDVIITSTGDPTLGSWRYADKKPEVFKQKFLQALKAAGITRVNGNLIVDDIYFDFQTVPGGWPWNDMGNYYGAGVWGVNWRENQFDININGKDFKGFSYELQNVNWVNELKAGGTTDQSLIFTAPHSSVALISGMLPAGKNSTVSGAVPNPPLQLAAELKQTLQDAGIAVLGDVQTNAQRKIKGASPVSAAGKVLFFTYESPTLDKIIYWFLRKSVNLYGETLIKTLGREKKNTGSFDAGLEVLKDFWKSKGIHPSMINFADGSGLSPQNYVSSRAEVQALVYAKKQPWFDVFFEGFPAYDNGMRMKSGTMKNTKSFAGYTSSKGGDNYVFSVIVNNYQGTASSEALQKILGNLKQ